MYRKKTHYSGVSASTMMGRGSGFGVKSHTAARACCSTLLRPYDHPKRALPSSGGKVWHRGLQQAAGQQEVSPNSCPFLLFVPFPRICALCCRDSWPRARPPVPALRSPSPPQCHGENKRGWKGAQEDPGHGSWLQAGVQEVSVCVGFGFDVFVALGAAGASPSARPAACWCGLTSGTV